MALDGYLLENIGKASLGQKPVQYAILNAKNAQSLFSTKLALSQEEQVGAQDKTQSAPHPLLLHLY